MATNKNALIRYKILDKCFRNTGRKYFINDLIDECNKVLAEIIPDANGISRRQIYEDISFMESNEGWNVDLAKLRDGKQVYYRYSDPDFSINNMPLNEIEIKQLSSALQILSQFKGMPQFEWVNELVPKLQQGIATDGIEKTIIEFDANQYLKGIEYIGPLYNAIFYSKVLSISYQPFSMHAPNKIILHPYYIKQYNNRWFLFGFNPEYGKYDWNLSLDRIKGIKELNLPYQTNDVIDWEEYFEDIIGVTRPVDVLPEDIIIHFKGTTGKYIETKPIHGSQKIKWLDEDTLEVKLNLIVNYEFERFILSYADNIIVLKPLTLKTKIYNRILDSIKNFEEIQ